MGAFYTTGTVYDRSGALQISDTLVDAVFANNQPYAVIPPRGKRYVIHLHNENHSERILPEDRRLLRAVGFNIDGRPPTAWRQLESHPGLCPLRLGPTFYRMLFIELCCGETSELCRLPHQTPACLGVRITIRHDVMNPRTMQMLHHCVTEYGFGKRVVVWMSFQCTGGSQMQHINEWKAHATNNHATLERINDARWEFSNHFTVSQPLVRLVRGLGGHIALELPRHCSSWSCLLSTSYPADAAECVYLVSLPIICHN